MSALAGQVLIDAGDIAGMDEGLPVRRAMELWCSRRGPVFYNTWQSVYFTLRRDYSLDDDEAAAGETGSDRQRRLKAWFEKIQADLYGPDFRAAAVTNDPLVPRVKAVAPVAPNPIVRGELRMPDAEGAEDAVMPRVGSPADLRFDSSRSDSVISSGGNSPGR